MNNEEKQSKLDFMQRFFALNFWLSLVILLAASAACIFMHDTQYAIVEKYFPVSIENFNLLVMLTFGLWKAIIIQFTLIPAIVIWIIRKCCQCKSECE